MCIRDRDRLDHVGPQPSRMAKFMERINDEGISDPLTIAQLQQDLYFMDRHICTYKGFEWHMPRRVPYVSLNDVEFEVNEIVDQSERQIFEDGLLLGFDVNHILTSYIKKEVINPRCSKATLQWALDQG